MSNNDNKFTQDIQTDIKIQRGLKILQFATEYNIAKVYYKNCPFNNYLDHKKLIGQGNKNKIIERNQVLGMAMSQLDEQIMKLGYQREINEKRKISQLRYEKFQFNVVREEMVNKKDKRQSSKIQLVGSGKLVAVEQKNMSNEEYLDQKQLQPYTSQVSSYRAPSKGSNNPSRKNRQSPRDKHQITLNNYVKNQDSIKEKERPSKPSRDKNQSSAFNNPTTSIKLSPRQKTSKSQISNNSSKLQSKNSQKTPKKQSKQQNSLTSKQYLQLNKTYSNILPNSNISKNKIANQSQLKNQMTQFQLLKELSDSLVDAENVKHLMKLQNVELEEKYLQHRINKRIQKGYQSVQQIRDVTWQSLKMPVINYQMKIFNIAHIID